jgi:2-dehydropantoate 2-reductase
MRIGVMGSGGVGGYFGGLLARSGLEVTFIARGAHLEALRAHGLQVKSVAGDFQVKVQATGDPAAVGVLDLILFCVKGYDTERAALEMRPMVGQDTAVICLQNGVDNEDKLDAILGPGHVLGGVVHILSTVSAPGVISQTSGPRTLKFGEMDGRVTPRTERILDLLKGAGILVTLSPQIQVDLWEKFLFICAHGGVTAVTRLTLGEILACAETAALYRGVMDEVAAVARARGIPLGSDIVERTMTMARTFAPGTRSSLAHDLVQGNRLELETLIGAVVRYGRDLGVPTPFAFAVYACLKPYHEMAVKARSG